MNKKTVILFYPLVEKGISNQNVSYALLYLERALRDLNINLILIDERIEPNYEEIIIAEKDRLLLAGTSCMIGYQIIGALNFSKLIKKHSTAPVIWGGWFPTVFSEMVLKENDLDFICIGQGEISFRELILSLLNNNSNHIIKGIISKKEPTQDISNKSLSNFQDLPPLNFDLLDINKIIDKNGIVSYGYRGTDYMATIGCPHNCAFCNLTYIFGSKWYPKPVDDIITDLKTLVSNGNLSHITFSDDNFFVTKRFVLEFCTKILESKLKITWEANTHVSSFLKLFNNDEIKLIKDSGCNRIKIGAESGDSEILTLINKRITVADNLEIVKRLKKYDIGVRYYTMVAFPHNPNKDFNKTLSMIGRARLIYNKLDFNINIFKPIPKTELFPLAQSFGFNYPETISGLLKLLEQKLVFPWHKTDYYYFLNIFSEIYSPFLDITYYQKYHGFKRGIMFIVNIYFYTIARIRIKLNFWRFPTIAAIYYKRKKEQNHTENVAILKNR